MADPSSSAGEDEFAEENEGGGESTVAMASPQRDPSVPLPISVPPPPMQGNGPPLQMQMPTAPVGFMPSGQGQAAFPVTPRPPPASQPNMPTPFGGLTPQGAPVGRPPVGTPPAPGVPGAFTGPPGLKRPQTVIGLAPPPVGAPRPGSPSGARVPLPSGRNAAPGSAPRPAVNGPADKAPPSSSRGVRPPAVPAPASTPSPVIATKDADSTDEQLAMPEELDTPDSQKEDSPTMAKSAEESLALFGLPVDARPTGPGAPPVPPSTRSPAPMPQPKPARSAPLPAAGAPVPVQAIAEEVGLEEEQHTALLPQVPGLGMPVPPPPPPKGETPLPVLHDRTEEEESTRAVSREEMLRGHEAVVIGDDMESAQGEDATLAVAPGLNEAASNQHLAALAATMTKDQAAAQGAFPPPPHMHGQQPPQQQPYPMDPSQSQPYLQAQQQQPPQQSWQDPAQAQWSQTPQDPNAYGQQQQHWQNGPASYPGSVGPVSGPHMPAATNQFPQSGPHMIPQSSSHLQVPQSGQMQHAGYQQQQQQAQPIPYPGQPIHQPPSNPFGDWNANANPNQPKKFLSGQVLLLAIVGTVCLAIFITGIVLFATTKF